MSVSHKRLWYLKPDFHTLSQGKNNWQRCPVGLVGDQWGVVPTSEFSISEHQICKVMKESKKLDPLVSWIITIIEKTFAYKLWKSKSYVYVFFIHPKKKEIRKLLWTGLFVRIGKFPQLSLKIKMSYLMWYCLFSCFLCCYGVAA